MGGFPSWDNNEVYRIESSRLRFLTVTGLEDGRNRGFMTPEQAAALQSGIVELREGVQTRNETTP
jgi:hypothetical protein